MELAPNFVFQPLPPTAATAGPPAPAPAAAGTGAAARPPQRWGLWPG